MEIQQVDPATLNGADYNPRQMGDKQRLALEQSLDEFGFVQPIVVNNRTGLVVGGHQRLNAAIALGHTEVPVVYVDLTEEREKALNVALNKISGDWDYPALIDVLTELEPQREFDLTGFDIDEFQALENDWANKSKAGTEGRIKPPPRIARSQVGEVYMLGDHVLVIGDSTDPDSYLHSPDPCRMMFTDPPYNVNVQGGTDEELTILNDNFSTVEGYRDFLLAFFLAAWTKNKGVSYVCYAAAWSESVFAAWRLANGHSSSDIQAVKREKPNSKTKATGSDGSPQRVLLWEKNAFSLGRGHYHWQHEPILYGWHDKADQRHWCGDRRQSSIWHYDKPSRNADHPTMKPVDLVERAIRNSSEPGDWVLDPFAGSGTTLVAADNIGRRCYTIELDPRYGDVIIDRHLSLNTGATERICEVEDSEPEGWWFEEAPEEPTEE